MADFIDSNLDYLILVAAMALAAWLLQWWLARRGVFHGSSAIWLALGAVLLTGWFATRSAGHRERDRIKQLLMGFPPTYAVELDRIGHDKITADTPADDPVYLDLIEAEKRWLKVNPYINDIYTIARVKDGGFVLLVDSETDYNRDGRIEGETEARTPIGESYASDDASLAKALDGEPSFSERPYVDRWGHWVSAYFPMRNAQGVVTAVVGVDFSAAEWMAAIRRARLGAIGMVMVVSLLCVGLVAAFAISQLQRQHAEQRKLTEIQKAGRERFETLVNSIDGIVYEFNLQSGLFDYVSNQAESILGFPMDHWLNKRDFWASRLAPEEKDKIVVAREQFLKSGASFEVEYRLLHADGHRVWIRERSQAVLPSGVPTLVRGVLFDVTEVKQDA